MRNYHYVNGTNTDKLHSLFAFYNEYIEETINQINY